MDVIVGFAIATGSLAIGAAGTIMTIRKGTVSSESCVNCKRGIDDVFRNHSEDLKDICTNIKKLHDKHDDTNKIIAETNAGLKEVIGFMKGQGKNI